MSESKLPDNGYICDRCAQKHGGRWPPDHVATMHAGTCCICHKPRAVTNIGDWDWPDGKPRGMRD